MLVLLIILIFIYHVGAAIYYLNGMEPLPTFEFLYNAAFLCGVVWLVRAGPKRSAVSSVYCHGMLVGIGWMIILPYHLLRTRSTRGLILVIALFASFLIAQILVNLIVLVFRPLS